LGQQTVSNLSNVVNLLGGSTGAYAKALKMESGVDRTIAMSSAMEAVKTKAALALSVGDYGKFAKQRKELTATHEGLALEEMRKGNESAYEGVLPEGKMWLDETLMKHYRSKPESRIQEGKLDREYADMFLERMSANPDQMKKFVVGSGIITGEGFEKRAEAGTLKDLFYEIKKISTWKGPVETRTF
ncbi:MAG: hypothetical protein IMF19_07570, partial [Proteobacteria bacterium]|nr:hypothetical protein [Pseudomonadota bacterium]